MASSFKEAYVEAVIKAIQKDIRKIFKNGFVSSSEIESSFTVEVEY